MCSVLYVGSYSYLATIRLYGPHAPKNQGCDWRRARSKLPIFFESDKVDPISSIPFRRCALRTESISNSMHHSAGQEIVCRGRSTSSSKPTWWLTSSKSLSIVSLARTIGKSPFLKQLSRKMSAKLEAISTRNPYCSIAHGACSRLDPQPKLAPASKNGLLPIVL